jgi:hypothetical protein
MKSHLLYFSFFLLFIYTKGNVLLYAQDGKAVQKNETFQLSDSLERELLLARKPLLAYAYYCHKAFGVSHFMITGNVSLNSLPIGLPGISETNTPLLQPTIGFGGKFFLGSIFYNFVFDVGSSVWQLPPNKPAETVNLSSLNLSIEIGYTAFKTTNFFLTPCVFTQTSAYTFDTNSSRRRTIYTGRSSLGGAVDLSYFLPIATSPFQSLEERTVGFKENIEAMISLRLGYAQYFQNSTPIFTIPTHQEFCVRMSVGIGVQKFIEEPQQSNQDKENIMP